MIKTVKKAIKNHRSAYRHGKNRVKNLWKRRRRPLDSAITSQIGWYPFNHNWKLLVVLDALRFDVAKESMATNRLGEPKKIWSVGANSPSWINRTFGSASPTILQNTAYISANPFTDQAPEALNVRDNVQKYAFDEQIGTIPPRPVTDRAIAVGRETSLDRYIVHYMQPHLPPVDYQSDLSDFIAPPDSDQESTNPWRDIEEGIRESSKVESAYRDNIHTVTSDLQLLLKNFGAEEVVITADHGNFLGEWGRWGHRYWDSIHPAVRYVPYWETSASDERTHSPSEYNQSGQNTSQMERLRALGYYDS